MVTAMYPAPGDDSAYEAMQEHWQERPSRKQAPRAYRRKEQRQVVVTAERLPRPDVERMSRALLAAQRQLAKAAAERDAQAQEHGDE